MGKYTICGAGDNFTVDCTEFFHPITESYDFCWTDKGAENNKKKKTSDCIYLLNKNMKNQRLYPQNNQENIITWITTQFENYLSYAYTCIYCMNIINAVATSTKDEMSLRGGLEFGVFFNSEKAVDNDLIIADYLYFIF